MTWPVVGRAQSPKPPLVAFLFASASRESAAPFITAFAEEMQTLGRIERQDYATAHRYSGGDMAAMPMLAAELVNLQPRVIVTGVTSGVVAIRRLTSTIQIVGSGLVDPVGLGLADSYARPGKSVTGLLLLVEGLHTKQMELASELIPNARRVGTLSSASVVSSSQRAADVEATAKLNIRNCPNCCSKV